MKDNEWKKTLAFGNSYEEILKELIPHKECVQSTKSNYDLILDGVKYEVKADRYMFKTNNVLIEYESNKKASGISITEADYYAIFEVDDKRVSPYLLEKDKTKEVERRNAHLETQDVVRGQNPSYELYLIPVKDIKELIKEKLYKAKISCGYNKLSQCYLFNKIHFDKYSQEIKD
jgi:hypothetical protein